MTALMQDSLFAPPRRAPPSRIGKAKITSLESTHILSPGRGSTRFVDYSLNAYRGCSFGCSYCYAPFFEPDEAKQKNWGYWVEVKERAVEALERVDLRGKKIYMSSVTDPYQPLEAKLKLTRSILELLLARGAHLIVQTRSPIVERDIDLLREFKDVRVNLSIPTDSDAVRKTFEPSAPGIERRLETARRLKKAGIRVHASVSPMLPMERPAQFGRQLTEIGIDGGWVSWFHQSERPFAASTRPGARFLADVHGWTMDEFRRSKEILVANCAALG